MKALSHDDRAAVIAALALFVDEPNHPEHRFHGVTNRSGFFTISASGKIRILLRLIGEQAPSEPGDFTAYDFEAVAVGNHDYVYASYFR